MTVLVNKSSNTVTVLYFDSKGGEQQSSLEPGKQFVVNGELHPATKALVKSKILATTSTVIVNPKPFSLALGTPLVWAGVWRPNALYKPGFVVLRDSRTFVAIEANASENPPTEVDSRWEVLSLKDFASTFDFLITTANNGAVMSYDTEADEWKLAKLTDVNIESITSGKISDLASVIGGLILKVGDTMTGFLTLSGNPTEALHAAPKQYVDTFLPKAGGTMSGFLTLSGNPTDALHAAPKQYVDNFLSKAGGTMTGALTLSGAPTTSLHAATKQYVDAFLPLAGGTMSGALTLSGPPTVNLHAATKAYVDAFLPLAGGTMIGALTLSGAPTVNLHAATKQYVDAFLPRAGGTMSGALTLSGAPTTSLHAATKAYVDAFLPLAGGAMSGALTGAHGLLPVAGGTMTGALILAGAPTVNLHAATKQYVDAFLPLAGGNMVGELVLHPQTLRSGNGFYEASDHSVPAWKSGLLQLNYPPTYFTGNHVATSTQGVFVFRGYFEAVLELSTNAPFATRLMSVANDGAANLYVRGDSEAVILAPGETLTLLPTDSDFVVVSRGLVSGSEATVDLASVGSEVAGTKNVTLSIYDITKETTSITLVENPSVGILRFTLASVTGMVLGSKLFVSGTTSYNGEYLINNIVGSTVSVQTSTPFVGTTTGSAGVTRLSSRTDNLPLVALVSETLEAWGGAAGASLSAVSGGAVQAASPSGNGVRLDTSSGTLVLNLNEQYFDYRVLFVHLLTIGKFTPVRSSPVSNVAKLALAIDNSTDNGGFLQIELATTDGFEVGDSVTLGGTSNNGDYSITAVLNSPPRVRLNTSYFAISSGTLTNNFALVLTVAESAGLAAGSYVYLKSLLCLGAQRVTREVMGVTSTTVIIKDYAEDFNAGLSKVGIIEQACIAKVEFLENSSDSSSSSSIQSSQSSLSSVNSSSSSSSSLSSVNSSSSSSSSSLSSASSASSSSSSSSSSSP